jgi:hypothetical protein
MVVHPDEALVGLRDAPDPTALEARERDGAVGGECAVDESQGAAVVLDGPDAADDVDPRLTE